MADTAISQTSPTVSTPRELLSPISDHGLKGLETDSEGHNTGPERRIVDKKKAASTTSAAPKRVPSTAKATGSLRSRTGPPGTAQAVAGLNKPPTRPAIPSGTTGGAVKKAPSAKGGERDAATKSSTTSRRASVVPTTPATSTPTPKSPERKITAADRKPSTLNPASVAAVAPRRPPSSNSTITAPTKTPKAASVGPATTEKKENANKPPSTTDSISSPVKTGAHSAKSSLSGSTSSVKRLSTIQGSPSPSTSSPGPPKAPSGGHVATLKARLQNAAGMVGFDAPAKEQVASLKSKVADLEKQLNDKNDALEREYKDGTLNGESGAQSLGDGGEVIAGLKRRIGELESQRDELRVENEDLKSIRKTVNEEIVDGAEDEEKGKSTETIEKMQTKIEEMEKEHANQVEKLKQELFDIRNASNDQKPPEEQDATHEAALETLKASYAAELAAVRSNSSNSEEIISKLHEDIASLKASLETSTATANATHDKHLEVLDMHQRELDGKEKVIKMLQDEISQSVKTNVQEMDLQMEELKKQHREEVQKLLEAQAKSIERETEVELSNVKEMQELKAFYEEKLAALENRVVELKKQGEEEIALLTSKLEGERNEIEQRLSSEKAQLESLKTSEEELKHQLEDTQHKLDVLVEQQKKEMDEHDAAIQEWREKLKLLEGDKDQAVVAMKAQLEEEKAELSKELDSVHQIELERLRSRFEAEKLELGAKLQQLKEDNDKELRDEKLAFDAEVSALKLSLDTVKKSLEDAHENISAKETALSEISAKLGETQEKLAAKEDDIAILERSHKTQTEALREELNSSSEEKYSSLNTKYDEAVKALDAARQAQSDEAEKVRDLEERVEKLKVDFGEAHTKFAEHEKSLASLQLEKEQLQQGMKAAQETLLSKIEELERKADATSEEKDRLLLERDELQKTLAEQQLVIEEQKQEFEATHAAATIEMNALQKQVEEFSATKVTTQAHLDNANIVNEKAKKSLDEERELTRSLRESVEKLKLAHTADKKGVEEQKSEMEKVLEEAKVQNAQLQQQVSEQKASIEDLQQRLTASRREQDDAQGQMAEELQQMSKMFSEQIEALESEKKALDTKATEATNRLEEQDMTGKQLKRDLSTTAEEKAQLEIKSKELEMKLGLKEKELEHVKKEGELAQTVHKAEIAEKEVEVKSLKEALKEVRRQTAHTTTVHPEDEHDRDGGPGDPGNENEGFEWIDAGKEADRVNGIVRHPLHNL